MATERPATTDSSRARAVREQFVAELDGAVLELAATVQGRLSALAEQSGTTREQQDRRDALLAYLRLRDAWIRQTRQAWRQALVQPGGAPSPRRQPTGDGLRGMGLTLMGNDEVESHILVSRLLLAIEDKTRWEFNDLRLRIMQLEQGRELEPRDVLRPETFPGLLVEHWMGAGLPREVWTWVQDSVAPQLVGRLFAAARKANAALVAAGVMPVIDRKALVRRGGGAVSTASGLRDGAATGAREGLAGGTGFNASRAGASGPGRGAPPAGEPAGAYRPGETRGGGVADETRMLTSTTPLARARQRAQGVLSQLKRLLTDRGADFESTHRTSPSPALAEALARPLHDAGSGTEAALGDLGTVVEPRDVHRVSAALRERTAELKRHASSVSEKATIEVVALMFQAILAEERIAPSLRVWFARLQMPVLRVALAEPDFFSTLEHPARQLIDRMGSCVLGFDVSGVRGSAMEAEVRRVVQVIEQYPETGRKVFQLVLDEFRQFLSRFLTEKDGTRQLVSVAQQVEQKETLTIQYTIELRKMLEKMKAREPIREFLFKVWAEVLAVAAIRQGAQHAETLALKRAAPELLWAASAKPSREERARVIRDLPNLLQRLRQGMTLLGMSAEAQDVRIKQLGDILTQAFMSKAETIPRDQIDDMARRLERLEAVVGNEVAGDIALTPQTLEMMFGEQAAAFVVLTDAGSAPGQAMVAWARELEPGHWFMLDHNGKVSRVQLVWRSDRRQLYLFASGSGENYLIQAQRLAAYLQAGLLVPAEDEALTVRATRDALAKLDANPDRLLA